MNPHKLRCICGSAHLACRKGRWVCLVCNRTVYQNNQGHDGGDLGVDRGAGLIPPADGRMPGPIPI